MLNLPAANLWARWAEKITDLWDVSFRELQDGYKKGDTRVLAYAPDTNFRFRFINITHLLNLKKKTWLTRSPLGVKK
jgi:hypothetical protein